MAHVAGTSYLSHEHHTSPVNGEDVKFYAVSLKVAAELKNVAAPLFSALSTLFQGVGQENGGKTVRKNFKMADGTDGVEEFEEIYGIDHKLAEVKIIEREKAIRQMVESLMNEKNLKVVAKFVMDSARETFPRPIQDSQVSAFMDSLDVVSFQQFLSGALVANKGVLGPLGQTFLDRVQGVFGAGDQPPQ